ncbi:hypothetical protein ASD02_32955 [Ensifer sp. Root1252]|nr:hypothetical protein ASD02_32955 [Ensifer sp. Root1252]KRC80676.1 hypothetical protein ASE32_24625 [Ensifer sp. Root231]KRC94572.1 hypothetical protein ASE47_34135 [Ensifer sp. Root258]
MAKLILGNRQVSIIIIIHAALMSAEKLSFLQWRMMAEAQRIAFITTQSSGCPLKILFFLTIMVRLSNSTRSRGRPNTLQKRACACSV